MHHENILNACMVIGGLLGSGLIIAGAILLPESHRCHRCRETFRVGRKEARAALFGGREVYPYCPECEATVKRTALILGRNRIWSER